MLDKDLVHFIITGGTIDSVWVGAQDAVVVSEHTVMPEYFAELGKNLKFFEEFKFTEVCMKDSRAITEDDRKNILKAIEESNATKIIITHGTYTMPDTARFLKDHLKRSSQVIVLTGSMVPIKGFDFSDGSFNLGFAFAQTQVLKPGVYVCMNARSFTPDEVAKNIAEGKFYSVFEDKQ